MNKHAEAIGMIVAIGNKSEVHGNVYVTPMAEVLAWIGDVLGEDVEVELL
jgi:hypothetical protein